MVRVLLSILDQQSAGQGSLLDDIPYLLRTASERFGPRPAAASGIEVIIEVMHG
jgi:hypothetical protein